MSETTTIVKSKINDIFGGVTVADILKQIEKVVHHTNVTYVTYDTLATKMVDGKDTISEGTATTYAAMVMSRESTNHQILTLYERMYDDLLRLNGLADE